MFLICSHYGCMRTRVKRAAAERATTFAGRVILCDREPKKGETCTNPRTFGEQHTSHTTQGRKIDRPEYDKNQVSAHLATWVGFDADIRFFVKFVLLKAQNRFSNYLSHPRPTVDAARRVLQRLTEEYRLVSSKLAGSYHGQPQAVCRL